MNDDVDDYNAVINYRQHNDPEVVEFKSVAMGSTPALIIQPFVNDEERECGLNVEASGLDADEVVQLLSMILGVMTEGEGGDE